MRPNKKDYKKFFSTGWRLTGLNASSFIRGSVGDRGSLVVCNAKSGHTFITFENEQQCLARGVELYKDEESFTNFRSAFDVYIEEATSIIDKYKEVRNLTREEYERDLGFIAKLWDYYGYLEFPYMDRAHEIAHQSGDTKMIERLDESAHFKFKARELMNTYLFSGGVMNVLAESLATQLSQPYIDALFSWEISDLFEGKKVDSGVLTERLRGYVLVHSENGNVVMAGDDALSVLEEFTALDVKNSIRGTSAYRGTYTGKALVVPMLVDHGEIAAVDARMQKGDVLVTETTSPDIMMLCRKAGAIVADQGGMLSHAAIVSRELKIPCVIGTQRATDMFRSGDMLEVDGDKGVVTKM